MNHPIRQNEHGQEIGDAIDAWTARDRPPHSAMTGRFCRVEPIDVERHGPDLYEANSLDIEGVNWTYLPAGPFSTQADYIQWMNERCCGADPMFHGIVDLTTGKAVGVASLMRMDPGNGVIEVGNINYSPALQKRPGATEAMYLLMQRVFDELGYRRYEWKCDSLNAPSRAAAARLGFTYEGLFRQSVVYKGRSRDTAWFSIVDHEWPAIQRAFKAWLDPANFDSEGRQHQSLATYMQRER